MTDQYIIELTFNRPPKDIKAMAKSLRKIAVDPLDANEKDANNLLYMADLADEIAQKMKG